MKEDIERIFKEQLQNYELPYEAGAWEAMSKRLDGTPSTPFYRKWWFAASIGTVLVGSATFFILSTNQLKSETAPSEAAITGTATPRRNSSVKESNNMVEATASIEQTDSKTVAVESQGINKQPTEVYAIRTGIPIDVIAYTSLRDPNNGTSTISSVESKLNPIIVPSSVCQNESFTIENPNAIDIHVKFPGGKEQLITGKKSLLIKPSEPGVITLKSGKLSETVTVSAATSHLFMDVDASVLYENGIPTVKFEVMGAENEISWESNIASRSIDKNKIIVHPFRERQVEVVASSTDQNGCVVTERKSITMEDNYNLIAMEAFRPTGEIEMNKLFMPFALTLRDTPFELTIFDPKNGTAVYTTSDASRGWDGTNTRKGEMVPVNSVWSWKVVMKNPLPGEPTVYSGTVTRL